MGTKIVEFEDNTHLEYDYGKIDQFCLYSVDSEGKRTPPTDRDYFNDLLEISNKYGRERVYKDFIMVYDHTSKEIDYNFFNDIKTLSQEYGSDNLFVFKLFSIFYLTMISEENRKGTRLGKRIKRLGVHSMLIENIPVQISINFMRSMGWREIDELCKERGF